MTVGVPDTGNSSWLLTYKNKDDKEKLERFETGETVPNRTSSNKNPRQARQKKPEADKDKRTRERTHEGALEAMRNTTSLERKEQERASLEHRDEADAEKKRQANQKKPEHTESSEYYLTNQRDEIPARGSASGRTQQSRASAGEKHFPKKDPKTGKRIEGEYETNRITEENVKRHQGKIQQEGARQRQAERSASESRKLEEEKRTKPTSDKRRNPQGEKATKLDRETDTSKILAEHSRDIDTHRAKLQTPKPKPKPDAWANLPKDHFVTNEKPVGQQIEERSQTQARGEKINIEDAGDYSKKSVQILKTLVKLSKLRSGLRKDSYQRDTGSTRDDSVEIKERLQNPLTDIRDQTEQQLHDRPSQAIVPKKEGVTPKKMTPSSEGGKMRTGGQRTPKQYPSGDKKIDSIGSKEERLAEIRANIKQRKNIKDSTRTSTDPKTGKKIKEPSATWDSTTTEREKRQDKERFSGEKVGNQGVEDASNKRGKLVGSKGKEIYDKLEGEGTRRAEGGKTEEEKEAGKQRRIQQYRETEERKQSESDSFKKGLKGGAKRKYETSDDKGKEAMFKKWKRSQGQKKKSDDIAEKLSSLNL